MYIMFNNTLDKMIIIMDMITLSYIDICDKIPAFKEIQSK